jgi:hypothetical protein
MWKNKERSPVIIIGGQTNLWYDALKKLQRSILSHRNTWAVWKSYKVIIYLYLNNYALCNGRKNIPRYILIRYRFNRTLLFIVSINLYYGCDSHYKSIKHKLPFTLSFCLNFSSFFFSRCNAWAYLLVRNKKAGPWGIMGNKSEW